MLGYVVDEASSPPALSLVFVLDIFFKFLYVFLSFSLSLSLSLALFLLRRHFCRLACPLSADPLM